jgi:hypothetical protein
LNFPSVQARKRTLFNALAQQTGDRTFFSSLDSVVYNAESEILKVALNCPDDIKLSDLKHFLFDDHHEFSCSLDSMIDFRANTVQVKPVAFNAALTLSGDIGLIPIPNSLEEHLEFKGVRTVSFGEMFGYHTRGQMVNVTLHGAASGSSKGTLCSFVHIKQKKYLEEAMKYTSQSLFDRILLGQYMVAADNKFGTFGDSGGLISLEPKSGRQVVGIFVGSFDPQRTKYVVSPAALLTETGYVFEFNN